jgi:hypothetical protein
MFMAADGIFPVTDDLIFIHHSCGNDWLKRGLHAALLEKPYIAARNDICYRADAQPDPGRPDSLRYDGKVPGDRTDMCHWIRWFNDYLGAVKSHGCESGHVNRIVMFKSCFPLSHIDELGDESRGDPFRPHRSIANYKAIFRHPDGSAAVYERDDVIYRPLEQVFADNPDTLFIYVTAPPLHYAPSDPSSNAAAALARQFNDWLVQKWLPRYDRAHPELRNVAVFDWFDVLAYPPGHSQHPNRLRADYGGETGDAHPNEVAGKRSVQVFATDADSFIDAAYERFMSRSAAATR